MPGYQARVTVRFGDQKTGRLFASACEAEGLSPEREGTTVTVEVHSHGNEIFLMGLVEEMNGYGTVKVLSDDD